MREWNASVSTIFDMFHATLTLMRMRLGSWRWRNSSFSQLPRHLTFDCIRQLSLNFCPPTVAHSTLHIGQKWCWLYQMAIKNTLPQHKTRIKCAQNTHHLPIGTYSRATRATMPLSVYSVQCLFSIDDQIHLYCISDCAIIYTNTCLASVPSSIRSHTAWPSH